MKTIFLVLPVTIYSENEREKVIKALDKVMIENASPGNIPNVTPLVGPLIQLDDEAVSGLRVCLKGGPIKQPCPDCEGTGRGGSNTTDGEPDDDCSGCSGSSVKTSYDDLSVDATYGSSWDFGDIESPCKFSEATMTCHSIEPTDEDPESNLLDEYVRLPDGRTLHAKDGVTFVY